MKCISIYSTWEGAYDTDTMFTRISNAIKLLHPDVIFVSVRNDNLVSIAKVVAYIKSLGVKVGIIADNEFDPYNFKSTYIEMYLDYFIYTKRPRKAIKFFDTKVISVPYDNIHPDYILESSGPSSSNGFALSENFDNITNSPFCIKALDTNYQHTFITDTFIEKWNRISQ